MGRPRTFSDEERVARMAESRARYTARGSKALPKLDGTPKKKRPKLSDEERKLRRKPKDAARYANDPQKYNQRSRDYASKNPEKSKAAGLRWVRENYEYDKARRAKYRKDNHAKIKAASELWRSQNKEKTRAKSKAYAKANADKRRASRSRRRARERGAKMGDQKVIVKWMKSWRSKRIAVCFWCRTSFPSSQGHADHIVPLARGGEHSIENLCISCSKCNREKHCRPLSEWSARIPEPVLL